MLIQRDTYFDVPRGRLKLREEPDAATPIAYQPVLGRQHDRLRPALRPDSLEQKESCYRLVGVEKPTEMREALEAVLGTSVVVTKERRLFLFKGVRIHLDRVDHLGDFIEFEGVATADEDMKRLEVLLSDLRQAFAIRNEDLLGGSYSDLLVGR